MAAVRIWQKKKLVLDHLTFKQSDMVRIGSTGLLSVFKRLAAHQGPLDAPAKPLTKSYAIWKSRKHKGRFRDLTVTGDMLRNLTLRTVTDNRAYAALTSRKERIKGLANAKRETWLVFSPANRRAVIERAKQLLIEMKHYMVRSSS